MAKKTSPRVSMSDMPTYSGGSLKRLRQISHLLDNAIPIPGTKYRFGLDPILGLLPGGGDMAGGLMSVYIVFEAMRMGVPSETVGRMGANIVLDLLTGTVPIVGDLFDVAFKANTKNVELLGQHIAAPEPSKASDKVFAVVVIVALIALVLGMAALSLWLITSLWNLIF